ncbi:Protein of unknown function [Gryllus bimaculatus]|nr:Protein of unknown function [Gryllus bimaculatus]
MTLLSIVLA